MADWETVTRFETQAGVTYKIQQRYDRSEAAYEVRLTYQSKHVTFEQNRWYVNEKVQTLE